MSKIVTLGEIMLRLSPQGSKRFVQVDSFDVIWGGGEANVAVSCANYGHDAYFVSKLPTHEIGQAAVNAPRRRRDAKSARYSPAMCSAPNSSRDSRPRCPGRRLW